MVLLFDVFRYINSSKFPAESVGGNGDGGSNSGSGDSGGGVCSGDSGSNSSSHNPQTAMQTYERNARKQTANEHLPLKHSTSRKWRTTSRVCSHHIHVGCKFYTILKFYFVIFAKLLAWRLYLCSVCLCTLTHSMHSVIFIYYCIIQRGQWQKKTGRFFCGFFITYTYLGTFFPFSVVVVVVVEAMAFFSDGEKCYIPPKSHMRWEHVKSIGKYHGIASHSTKFWTKRKRIFYTRLGYLWWHEQWTCISTKVHTCLGIYCESEPPFLWRTIHKICLKWFYGGAFFFSSFLCVLKELERRGNHFYSRTMWWMWTWGCYVLRISFYITFNKIFSTLKH